jgi:hypothetical protein
MPQPSAAFPAGRRLRIDKPGNSRFAFCNDRMRANRGRERHQSEHKKGGMQGWIYHDLTAGTIGAAQ